MNDDPRQSTRLAGPLASPFAGFAPWIVMSVVEGPGRFELAAVLAFTLALLIGAIGASLGMRPKLLDLVAIAFFGALIVAGLVVDAGGLHWLERWSGELSNLAIALIALLSLVLRRPFTLEYARETTDRLEQESPLFQRINYVLTSAWTTAFAVIAIVGYIGDGPLDQPDNSWTNWIVQIAMIVLATKFTEWYPEYATAATSGPRSAPSVRALLLPLGGYMVTVGIVLLAVGGTPFWAWTGLVVTGGILTGRLQDAGPLATPRSAARQR